ncbi:MAG: GTP-binding protein [Proteobacteria bacterium]|nr:GTP-binding protein [Pseudomonadota bacterium]
MKKFFKWTKGNSHGGDSNSGKHFKYKISVFGEQHGKTVLCGRFLEGEAFGAYNPTAVDVDERIVSVDGTQYTLGFIDTNGGEQFRTMRDLYMKNSQGIVIVYNVNSRVSFEYVKELYDALLLLKEIQPEQENIPIVIAENDSPLEGNSTVSPGEGLALAKKLNCGFIEISTKTLKNIDEVFYMLAKRITEWNEQQAAMRDSSRIKNGK